MLWFENTPVPPFLSPSFVLYTIALLPFSPSTCGLGVQSSLSPSLSPFLESSILSWKAACSLFKYHLHINAARRLAGRHLMRRWHTLRYLLFLTLILYLIFPPSFCCKVCPRRYSKWLISLPDTLDRSSKVAIVLGHGQIPHKHCLPLLGG